MGNRHENYCPKASKSSQKQLEFRRLEKNKDLSQCVNKKEEEIMARMPLFAIGAIFTFVFGGHDLRKYQHQVVTWTLCNDAAR